MLAGASARISWPVNLPHSPFMGRWGTMKEGDNIGRISAQTYTVTNAVLYDRY